MSYKNLDVYIKIIRILFFKKFSSRVEIAKTLNLTRATITNVTKKLIEKNIIKIKTNQLNIERVSQTVGKKKQYIKINENFKFVFGATIEKNILRIALCNLNGEIISRYSFKILQNYKINKILNIIYECYTKILKQNYLSKKDILAFGICLEDEIKNKYLEYIENFFKNKLNIFLYINDLRYGLAISEILFFFKKHNTLKENNMFIFLEYEIFALFLERKNIFENYNIKNSNFAKIISYKNCYDFEFLGDEFKNLYENKINKKINDNSKTEEFLDSLFKSIYNAKMLTKIDNIIIYSDFFKLEDFKIYINKNILKDLLKDVEIIYKNSRMLKEQKFLTGCAISLEYAFLNLEYFKNNEL